MIKLTNKCFGNPIFGESIKKIYFQDNLPITTAFALNRLYKDLEAHNISYLEVKSKIEDKWSITQDNKVIIPEENITSFNKEMEELLTINFELPANKLEFSENMKLSAGDIEVLEPLIDFSSLGM